MGDGHAAPRVHVGDNVVTIRVELKATSNTTEAVAVEASEMAYD